MSIAAFLSLAIVRPAGATTTATAAGTSAKIVLTDTNADAKTCKAIIPSTEPGRDFGTLRCLGTAGFSLDVKYDDARDDLTVIDPSGRETSLRLGEVVGSSFSALGKRAEWRVVGGKAVALTVRFELPDPSNDTKKISYLVVAKLAPKPCVVAKILPSPAQNTTARATATKATTLACLAPAQ